MHLTSAEYADLIKRRPNLAPALGAVPAKVAKPAPAPALDGSSAQRKGGKARLEGCVGYGHRTRPIKTRPGGSQSVIVTFTAYRRTLLDDDNNVASVKPLRDAVAEYLGCDDGDPRIRWEYGQVETRGTQGVAVKIESKNPNTL